MEVPWKEHASTRPFRRFGRGRRTLLILVTALSFAGAGPAQTSGSVAVSTSSEWKTGNCESPSRLSMLQQLAGAFREPDTLAELHEILRNVREPHDAYARIEKLATEETVPLLLERLRIDYGAAEPVQVPGRLQAVICTHAHLISALRSITNTDQGYYYPRWAAWWAANQTLPRRRWIIDGFAAGGLHAVAPVDERLALSSSKLW